MTLWPFRGPFGEPRPFGWWLTYRVELWKLRRKSKLIA